MLCNNNILLCQTKIFFYSSKCQMIEQQKVLLLDFLNKSRPNIIIKIFPLIQLKQGSLLCLSYLFAIS